MIDLTKFGGYTLSIVPRKDTKAVLEGLNLPQNPTETFAISTKLEGGIM